MRNTFHRLVASLLGWGVLGLGCLVLGVLGVPPTLLLSSFWPGVREHFAAITRRFLQLYTRTLLFVRFQVTGSEQRLRGARILVANHQSFLDPIVLIALEPRLGGPIRRYLSRLPLFGAITRLGGFYAAEIGEPAPLDQLARSAASLRERGGGLLFFPEGSRSKNGEVGRFHRGAFRAAVDHELPIQPVVIEGLDRVLPPGKLLTQTPGRYPVRISYLDPVEPPFGSGVRRDVVRGLADRVRGSVVEELARLRAERPASASAG